MYLKDAQQTHKTSRAVNPLLGYTCSTDMCFP